MIGKIRFRSKLPLKSCSSKIQKMHFSENKHKKMKRVHCSILDFLDYFLGYIITKSAREFFEAQVKVQHVVESGRGRVGGCGWGSKLSFPQKCIFEKEVWESCSSTQPAILLSHQKKSSY